MLDIFQTGEIIILSKDEHHTIIAFERLVDNDVVSCWQSKDKNTQRSVFFKPNEADNEFMRSSGYLLEHNWEILYHGNRNYG